LARYLIINGNLISILNQFCEIDLNPQNKTVAGVYAGLLSQKNINGGWK
jgi:hypothetical protein